MVYDLSAGAEPFARRSLHLFSCWCLFVPLLLLSEPYSFGLLSFGEDIIESWDGDIRIFRLEIICGFPSHSIWLLVYYIAFFRVYHCLYICSFLNAKPKLWFKRKRILTSGQSNLEKEEHKQKTEGLKREDFLVNSEQVVISFAGTNYLFNAFQNFLFHDFIDSLIIWFSVMEKFSSINAAVIWVNWKRPYNLKKGVTFVEIIFNTKYFTLINTHHQILN